MRNLKSNYEMQVEISKNIFLKYDQELLIKKFQLKSDDEWMYIDYLNTSCRISRMTGEVEEYIESTWKTCRTYVTVMTIYDLRCFHQGDHAPELWGQWCPVGSFIITGVQDTGTFTKKYASMFDGHLDELKEACQAIGGVFQPRMAGADITCKIDVTPFFPVLLQFWEGDEEFPPKLVLLWDKNADQFLHFETTFFLQGDILERLKDCMEKI